jgi:hypothetical protein
MVTLFLAERCCWLEVSTLRGRQHLVENLSYVFPFIPILGYIVGLFTAFLELFKGCADSIELILPV